MIFRSILGLGLALGAAGAGCASFGEGTAGSGGCVGLQCPGAVDGGDDDGSVIDAQPDGAGQDADAAPPLSALCATGCDPDEPTSCDDAGTGMAADAASPSGDAAPDAFAGQPSSGDAAPDAGGAPPARFACHLTRHNGKPAAVCEPAGQGTEHAPCVDSGDCAPGYGCVLDGTAGECRRFCCAGNSGCECDPEAGQNCDAGLAGTFCAERPLKDGASGQTEPQLAPVCVPADNCNLAEPYPCAASDPADCTCPEPGTACMVVGDGLTSCRVPQGTGKAGDDCPCAWGHVCSQATGKCLKICSLTTSDSGCGNGKCQASKQMPDNFGVCIPSTSPDGGY